MENTPKINKINRSLEKVVNHHLFVTSPRNARLLSFLVEQAVNGIDVKEHVIGVELFQNNYNPDSNDGRVRVSMYNLRKKLEEYYREVGAVDDVFFEIKKGQYNIQFVAKEAEIEEEEMAEKSMSSLTHSSAIIIAAVVLSTSALVFMFYPKSDVYCWDGFFSPKAKNLCVIADHIICEKEQEDGSWLPVHIKGINSQYELSQYLSENNITDLRAADYTMMTKMAPYAMHELDAWFHEHDNKLEVRLESEFRLEETRYCNLIYVGQFKTMNASGALFLNNSKVFSKSADGIVYDDGNIRLKYATHVQNGKKTAYAMVSFMPLEKGSEALFLTSNHDIGTLATVRSFTNQDWLDRFLKNFLKVPNTSTLYLKLQA